MRDTEVVTTDANARAKDSNAVAHGTHSAAQDLMSSPRDRDAESHERAHRSNAGVPGSSDATTRATDTTKRPMDATGCAHGTMRWAVTSTSYTVRETSPPLTHKRSPSLTRLVPTFTLESVSLGPSSIEVGRHEGVPSAYHVGCGSDLPTARVPKHHEPGWRHPNSATPPRPALTSRTTRLEAPAVP
jgi:hypothetical protein